MPHRTLNLILLLSVISASLLFSNKSLTFDQPQQTFEGLTKQLSTGDPKAQHDAAINLSYFGDRGIPPLIQALKTSRDPEVLGTVAQALGSIGPNAVPFLVRVLHDENSGPKNILVLRFGANALKSIADPLKCGFPEAVPELIRILENKARAEADGGPDEELQDYDAAADCLAYFGRASKTAAPLLIELLPNERNRRSTNRYHKMDALRAIIDQLRAYKDFSDNDSIIDAFERTKPRLEENDRTELANLVYLLKRDKTLSDLQFLTSPTQLFAKYPLVTLFILAGLFGAFVWFALFLFRPLWLLRIHDLLPMDDARLSGFLGSISVPLGHLWGRCMLRPRVLDAWVSANREHITEAFSAKDTIRARQVYVPLPVFIDGRPKRELKSQHLVNAFKGGQSRVLIYGVGGSGKTTLAYQIAKWAMRDDGEELLCPAHPMLPVLLEHDFSARGENSLRDEIFDQLSDRPSHKSDASPSLSQALLSSLLKHKRILVLIDGLSERNDETRRAIQSGVGRHSVKAIVFTSRTQETLGGLQKTVINPTNIKNDQLSSFVGAYLITLGKRELFSDVEFFEACKRMSQIVGNRHITVLLAELFVEQMVAKREGVITEDLPQTIPEVFLWSIKVIHKKTQPEEVPLNDVIRASLAIAWECLKESYRPVAADSDAVEKAMAKLPNGEKALKYLEKVGLIDTLALHQKVRFRTDPLAEYLAAIHVTRNNEQHPERWQEFLSSLSSEAGSMESIRGFITALQDCCAINERVPRFVLNMLTDLLESKSDPQRSTAPGGYVGGTK